MCEWVVSHDIWTNIKPTKSNAPPAEYEYLWVMPHKYVWTHIFMSHKHVWTHIFGTSINRTWNAKKNDKSNAPPAHHECSRVMYKWSAAWIFNAPLIHEKWHVNVHSWDYGVATISRLLKIIGLLSKKALQKRLRSAKETYNFKKPTSRTLLLYMNLHHEYSTLHLHTNIQSSTYTWDITRA